MKKIIAISVLSLLMIIEFYPVESNSQDLPEGRNFNVNQLIIQPLNENTGLSGPEIISSGNIAEIKFHIISEGKVNLDVYNTEGELIETLAEGEMEQGDYTVYFKATDDILPGIYNCKLKFNTIELNKEIVLRK